MRYARPDIVVKDDEPGDHQAFLRCMSLMTTQTGDDAPWRLDGQKEWTRDGWCIRIRGDTITVATIDEVVPRTRRGLVQIRGAGQACAMDDPSLALLTAYTAMRMVDGRGDDAVDVGRLHDWATAMLTTASEGRVWMKMTFPSPLDAGWIRIPPGASQEERDRAERLLAHAPTMMHWNAYMDGGVPHLYIQPMSLDTGRDADSYPTDDAMETMRCIARVEQEIEGRIRPGAA